MCGAGAVPPSRTLSKSSVLIIFGLIELGFVRIDLQGDMMSGLWRLTGIYHTN